MFLWDASCWALLSQKAKDNDLELVSAVPEWIEGDEKESEKSVNDANDDPAGEELSSGPNKVRKCFLH